MNTNTVRRVAELIRKRASAATPSPWRDGERIVIPADYDGADTVRYEIADTSLSRHDHQDSAHIASWHPAVALAVADWLDAAADESEHPLNTRGGILGSVDRHALAVARAYLGETA